MNVKGTRARMGAFAQILLPTTPVNARGSTWEGTVSTVSALFLLHLSSNSVQVVSRREVVQQPSKLKQLGQFYDNPFYLTEFEMFIGKVLILVYIVSQSFSRLWAFSTSENIC